MSLEDFLENGSKSPITKEKIEKKINHELDRLESRLSNQSKSPKTKEKIEKKINHYLDRLENCLHKRRDCDYMNFPRSVRDKNGKLHYIDKRSEGLEFCKSFQAYVKKNQCNSRCNRFKN